MELIRVVRKRASFEARGEALGPCTFAGRAPREEQRQKVFFGRMGTRCVRRLLSIGNQGVGVLSEEPLVQPLGKRPRVT